MINEDLLDYGLLAVERMLQTGTKIVAEAGGFVVIKTNGVRYTITPDMKCDCQSRRDCYHLKVARLLRELSG